MSAAVIPFPARQAASPQVESYAWLRIESQLKARRVLDLMQEASPPSPPDGVGVQAEILAALQRIEHHLSRLSAH